MKRAIKPVNQRPVIHICSFSSGIDEMKRKDWGDIARVARVLFECKRFSVFEATANSTIARTMNTLEGKKYVIRTGGSYPWIEVELTRKGLLLIGEPVPEEPKPSNVIAGAFGQ